MAELFIKTNLNDFMVSDEDFLFCDNRHKKMLAKSIFRAKMGNDLISRILKSLKLKTKRPKGTTTHIIIKGNY